MTEIRNEEISSETTASSDETVVEKMDADTHMEMLQAAQAASSDETVVEKMLQAAHDSLDGKTLSDISINHPYWGLMNAARQFKHEKGLQ